MCSGLRGSLQRPEARLWCRHLVVVQDLWAVQRAPLEVVASQSSQMAIVLRLAVTPLLKRMQDSRFEGSGRLLRVFPGLPWCVRWSRKRDG